MKVKKNIYHVIFFDILFETVCFFLVALGFFLGAELTKRNILIYLLINIVILIVGFIVYFLYAKLCKTYYEFTDNAILLTKNETTIKTINYNQMRKCEYYKFVNFLLGDSCAGRLVVYYRENDMEKTIEISLSKKLLKKLPFNHISIL